MSNSKTYMIVGGIAAVAIISLLVAWWMGCFSDGKSSSSSTSSTEPAKLSDEKIGELNIEEIRKAISESMDATIFKELVHSLKSLTSGSEELIKKIAVESVKDDVANKTEAEKTEITDKKCNSVKEKMSKFKTDVFKSTDDFKNHFNKFNKLALSKDGEKLKVTSSPTADNEKFIAKYKSILGEISNADTYKMDSDLKSAITTDKYEYSQGNDPKKLSAYNAIGYGFVTELLA